MHGNMASVGKGNSTQNAKEVPTEHQNNANVPGISFSASAVLSSPSCSQRAGGYISFAASVPQLHGTSKMANVLTHLHVVAKAICMGLMPVFLLQILFIS